MAKPEYRTEEDRVTFNIVDKDTVDRLRRNGDIELPYKTVDIDKDMRWNTKQMASKLLQGILNGDSIPAIAKSLTAVIGNNKASAIRNARTMVTGAENAGRLDSYKNLESQGVVQNKVWIATPDARTRKTHAEIDGEEIDINDQFSNGLEYPGDPHGDASEVYNCRCSMRTHIIGFKRSDGSVSRVNYDRDRTMHDEQMNMMRERNRRKIREKSTTPITLSHYDQAYKSFRQERLNQIDDITPFEQLNETLNQMVENNDFRVRFAADDGSVLESILSDGRLKTQFETNTSKGALNTDIRKDASHNLFNSPSDTPAREYEKYGYLGSKEVSNDLNSPFLYPYGNGVITLRKSEVIDRTTITVGDSLRNSMTGRNMMGSKVTDIDSVVCIERPSIINDLNKSLNNNITRYGIDDASSASGMTCGYLELQYHGDITLKDIESITVDRRILDGIKENSDLLNVVKESGIEFRYIENNELHVYNF